MCRSDLISERHFFILKYLDLVDLLFSVQRQESIIITPFTKQVVAIIAAIPEGKVMTYGQIAALAGSPRAARQVVRILHSMSRKERLPWHRVVNAKGEVAIPDDESRMMQENELISEGVEFQMDGTIDLIRFRHEPDPDWLLHHLVAKEDADADK